MRYTPRVVAELLGYLFASMGEGDAAVAGLHGSCARRAETSARFAEFLGANRDKIRKKLREAGEPERIYDVQLELETAYRLLADRRIAVAYEALAAQKGRSPDFTATYTTKHTFHVEVKRLRIPGTASSLMDALCAKLPQLQPNALNVVVIGTTNQPDSPPARALSDLLARAERKDEDYFTRRGFRDASDFLKRYRRLSAVLFLAQWQTDAATATLCLNPVAQHPLPAELQRALAAR